ncbi:sigma-70 family RNA polymerase sigma factor [Candidatus Poribacteria bacterium]
MMEFSDAVLVEKTLEGDELALRTLINRHSGVVHGLCYHLVRNFADAADLAQEAFIRAYLRLSSLSDPSRFPSWLRQITTNVCHDWLRRQRDDIIPLEAASKQPDISSSPSELFEAEELQRRVLDAIESLSDKNRQAVTLYYLDGCSCSEVADFLDVSVSVVQSRLYEARKQLKKELMAVVKEDLESRKLPQDFDEKVLGSIEQAKKAQEQHTYREVIRYCDDALGMLQELPDSLEHKKMKKEALLLRGKATAISSRKDAIGYYKQALELDMEIGSESDQAKAFHQMGLHYDNTGDWQRARDYYERALELFEQLGDKSEQAEVLRSMAGRRDIDEAISYYQRSLELSVEAGNKKTEASCRAGLNLKRRFGKRIKEAKSTRTPSKMVFEGVACELFVRSPDGLMYNGRSGGYGLYISAKEREFESTFNASPFCYLPGSMTKLLDSSLSVGNEWSMYVPSGSLDPMKITVTVESDSEIASVPAGDFSNCLKTKIATSEEPADCSRDKCGEREFVYAPGVGLIKATYTRRDGATVTAQLTSYTVSNGDKDYFPLDVGSKWVYEWSDIEGVFPSTDVFEVIGTEKKQYYVSHYYYALKELKTIEPIEQAREAQSQYRHREAIKHSEDAMDELAKLPDSLESRRMMRDALRLKASALNKYSSRKEANKYYEQALEIEMEIGNRASQAHAIGEMGRHYSNAGDREKAVEYYGRALGTYTELGDKVGQAGILMFLASQHLYARNIEESLSHYQRAYDIFQETGRNWDIVSCQAGVDLLKQFGQQIQEASFETESSEKAYYGAVCCTFRTSPDAVVYRGMSGTFGVYPAAGSEFEEVAFNATPFHFLPTIKLLDSSLSVGANWSEDVPSGGLDPMKLSITAESNSEAIAVPAGEFTDCLKMTMVTSEEPKDGNRNLSGRRELIYAPGIGLVKAGFVRRDGAIAIAQLTSYQISGDNESHFPLELGNRWIYEWSDADGRFPSTDVYEVARVDDRSFYVSHYFYALTKPT